MRFFIVLSLLAAITGSVSAQTVKVMTYNLRLDTPDDGVNQWPKRTDKVVALINKYNPDIIGVQEALHHQLQDLLRLLPGYSYCGVGRDDGKEKGEYSAILFRNSRFGLLDSKTYWLSETMDVPGSKSWDAAITRVFTLARFFDRDTKKEFVMVNTHFDHIGKTARLMSANLIKGFLIGMQDGASVDTSGNRVEIPVIVSGDFNSEPTEEPYRTMVSDNQPVVLYDSRPASSTAGTFCGFKVGGMPCKTIDFIFHTKQWVAQNYQVITDNDGTYYPSDHLPVLVDFTLALEK